MNIHTWGTGDITAKIVLEECPTFEKQKIMLANARSICKQALWR